MTAATLARNPQLPTNARNVRTPDFAGTIGHLSPRQFWERVIVPRFESLVARRNTGLGRKVQKLFTNAVTNDTCRKLLGVREGQAVEDRAEELLSQMFNRAKRCVLSNGPLRNVTFPLSINQTVTGEAVIEGLEVIKTKGYAGWRSLPENVRGTIVFCVMTLDNNIFIARSATN